MKEFHSDLNGTLEINMVNGKKLLDTSNSNYSYGSLQAILKLGLLNLEFNSSINNVLVLGMGGGSVVATIRDDFASSCYVELVEIDPLIISIAESEFNILRYQNISVVNADAFEHLQNSKTSFDLIIVDLFILNTVPIQFTSPDFLKLVDAALSPKGKIIYNTMRETMGKEVFQSMLDTFKRLNLKVRILEKVGGMNDLILAEKEN